MASSEDDIGALAGQWELVFEDDLDISETRVDQVGTKGRDAAAPRALLTGARSAASLDDHLLREVVREIGFKRRQPLSGGAEQMHGRVPRQHEVTRAGGGMSKKETRRAAMT